MDVGDQTSGRNGTRCVPILPSRDLRRSAAFYAQLGFETDLFADGDEYMIAHRDWLELHFFAMPGLDPATGAQSAYVRVADVDRTYASLEPLFTPSGSSRLVPPTTRPWGMREAYLFDPDNNLIKLGTPTR
jgi:catechol 2,3-dioxygenase-like lactoylglutathione lyase family enzyme